MGVDCGEGLRLFDCVRDGYRAAGIGDSEVPGRFENGAAAPDIGDAKLGGQRNRGVDVADDLLTVFRLQHGPFGRGQIIQYTDESCRVLVGGTDPRGDGCIMGI